MAPVTRVGRTWRRLGQQFPMRALAAALDYIRNCPPLADHLEEAALGHLADLERKLFVDETLNSAERSNSRTEITRLEVIGRPIWDTWIEHTPSAQHHKFDRLIALWLNAPPHGSEADWFQEDLRRPLASLRPPRALKTRPVA